MGSMASVLLSLGLFFLYLRKQLQEGALGGRLLKVVELPLECDKLHKV